MVRSIWDFYPVVVDAVWGQLSERSDDFVTTGDDDSQFWLINAHYAADIWNAEAYLIGLTDSGNDYDPITIGFRGDVAPLDGLDIWGEFDYQTNKFSEAADL